MNHNDKPIIEMVKSDIEKRVRNKGFAYVHPQYKRILTKAMPANCVIVSVSDDGFTRIERKKEAV